MTIFKIAAYDDIEKHGCFPRLTSADPMFMVLLPSYKLLLVGILVFKTL